MDCLLGSFIENQQFYCVRFMTTIWHHMCTNQMMVAKFTLFFFFWLHIMMFHLLNLLSLLIGCIFITLTGVESIIVWILHWISVIIIFWPFLEVQSFVMCFLCILLQGEDTQWVKVDLVNPEPSTNDWVGVFSPANFKYCSSLSLWTI